MVKSFKREKDENHINCRGTKCRLGLPPDLKNTNVVFSKDMPFELIEIPAGKRGKNADIKRIFRTGRQRDASACGKGKVVTLDIPGKL